MDPLLTSTFEQARNYVSLFILIQCTAEKPVYCSYITSWSHLPITPTLNSDPKNNYYI